VSNPEQKMTNTSMAKPSVDYEQYADKYVQDYTREPVNRYIYMYIQDGTVLDVGCGNGDLLTYIRKNEFPNSFLQGIEISKRCVEMCKEKGLNVSESSIEDFEPKERYDNIIMSDVLEHVADYKAVIRRVKRMLKTNGRLILTLPNPQGFRALLKLIENPSDDPSHIYCPNYFEITKEIKKAGFSIIGTMGLSRYALPTFLAQGMLIASKKK